jgi:hypothetical protein
MSHPRHPLSEIPITRSGSFDALESSFFDQGTAIENGTAPAPEEDLEQDDHLRGQLRLRRSPGLAAACVGAVLLVGGLRAWKESRAPVGTANAASPSSAAAAAASAPSKRRPRRSAVRPRSTREAEPAKASVTPQPLPPPRLTR